MPLVAVLVGLVGCTDEASKVTEDVQRVLLDPESAQFRDVQPCEQANAFRGQVNSKNAYGGYVGFREFIWVDGAVAVSPGPTSAGSSQDQIDQLRNYLELGARCVDEEQANEIRSALSGR